MSFTVLRILLFLLLLNLANTLFITEDTLVAVKCAAATGSINCDWKCFDNCIYDKPELLKGDEFKQCIAALEEPCLVPATTYLVLELSDFCYKAEANIEGSIYSVAIPQLRDDLWLRLHSQKVREVSLNIASDEFNSTSCLASMAKFGLSSTPGLSDPCAAPTLDAGQYSQIEAPFTFGFTQLSVNVSEWAQAQIEAASGVGDHDQVLHLMSASVCAGTPKSMTVSYTSDIIVDASNYNASPGTVASVPLIAAVVLGAAYI